MTILEVSREIGDRDLFSCCVEGRGGEGLFELRGNLDIGEKTLSS